MELTGKATPQYVKTAWSVSVTALFTIVVYHHLSGSSSRVRNRDDRKIDTSKNQNVVKCFSDSFIYDCCISSFVRILIDYFKKSKKRWQEERHLNLSKLRQVIQLQLCIRLLYIINCQDLQRLLEMEKTGISTPRFVEGAWSVSVVDLYTAVVYHQLSGSSSIIWNGDDRKCDTSFCRKSVKCFSNSFIYDCYISSIDRIFPDYLKCRWQENQHLKMSKRREVFQWQLYIRLLYIIFCQYLHWLYELEMTGRATPQFVERARSSSVTALYTIVVYHSLSGSSSINRKRDNRKSVNSICRKGVKFFGNRFNYDCCLSSFVRIFIEYLKWRWQKSDNSTVEKALKVPVTALNTIVVYHRLSGSSSFIWNGVDRKATPQFVERAWSFSVTDLITIVVYHQLSGSSTSIGNGDDRNIDTSICRKGVKCFSNSFLYDCCLSSFVRIFIEYLKWRWQKSDTSTVEKALKVPVTALNTIVVYHRLSGSSSFIWNGVDRKATPQFVERA